MISVPRTRATCFTALTVFIRRLQGRIHDRRSTKGDIISSDDYNCCDQNKQLPQDVKEGCFTILAVVKNEEPARFVVKLRVLKNPEFLRLLKLAEEEYGFQHKGALAIPCRPDELKIILTREE